MSEQKNTKGPEHRSRGGNDKKNPQLASRGMVAWLFILGIICILILFRDAPGAKQDAISYSQLVKLVEQNKLLEGGEIVYNPQAPELKKITGAYFTGDKPASVL